MAFNVLSVSKINFQLSMGELFFDFSIATQDSKAHWLVSFITNNSREYLSGAEIIILE